MTEPPLPVRSIRPARHLDHPRRSPPSPFPFGGDLDAERFCPPPGGAGDQGHRTAQQDPARGGGGLDEKRPRGHALDGVRQEAPCARQGGRPDPAHHQGEGGQDAGRPERSAQTGPVDGVAGRDAPDGVGRPRKQGANQRSGAARGGSPSFRVLPRALRPAGGRQLNRADQRIIESGVALLDEESHLVRGDFSKPPGRQQDKRPNGQGGGEAGVDRRCERPEIPKRPGTDSQEQDQATQGHNPQAGLEEGPEAQSDLCRAQEAADLIRRRNLVFIRHSDPPDSARPSPPLPSLPPPRRGGDKQGGLWIRPRLRI